MNYPDSVRYLYALGNELKTAKFGLETITALAGALGNPERAFRSVHVAGTNGKGSTSAMLESALRTSGSRTGLYTSPHLAQPTERIQIAGASVTDREFAEAFDIVHQAAERLIAGGAIEYHPTYFETVTAMAFVLFRQKGVETVVVEVGLGGRLDATNIVTPALSVITRIDFDHEAFLGRSIEAIAGEKAGILKRGVAAVFAPQRPEAEATLRARAAEMESPVTQASDWTLADCSLDARGSSFSASKPGSATLRIRCPLAGEHQIENALTAIEALSRLGVNGAAIESGIAAARWPGRLELVSTEPEIILDGAHNPSGARALAAYVERFHHDRRICLVYGAMRDKSVEEVTGILFPLADLLILTAPKQDRATRPETIRDLSGRDDAIVAPDVAEALAIARARAPNATIFVTGSLFVVAEARSLL